MNLLRMNRVLIYNLTQRRIQGGGLSPTWKTGGINFQGGFSPQRRSDQIAQPPLPTIAIGLSHGN